LLSNHHQTCLHAAHSAFRLQRGLSFWIYIITFARFQLQF